MDDRDVANASKGFNPQVESAYRQKNPSANFAAVDRMERLGASDRQVAAFASDGSLKQRGAGKELWMTEVYYPNSNANSGDAWPEALDPEPGRYG